MRCCGWCGLCYANLRGRANYSGHCHCVRMSKPLRLWIGSSMKKPQVLLPGPAGPMKVKTCGFAARYPSISAFLSEVFWDDGSCRVPGTLLVCYDDGRPKAWLNDKGLHRTAWLSADSLEGLWDTMEAVLRDEAVEWRAAKPASGRRGVKGG
jgi:hypothetical protein